MKFLAFTLLATAAFASPNPANGQKYIRRSANRQSKAAKLISDQVVSSNAAADDVQSANWGGAVLTADTATYTSVTGTFTISAPSGLFDTDEECAFVWVGIDGASSSCQGLLQTGVNLCTNEGVISFTGWYEYFPAPMSDFSDITFSAGDSVTLTATVTSSTSGVLTITNNSKNVTVSQAVTSTSALCQESAEWIVEQCDDCDVIDFPDFGTVEFTGASATTSSGAVVSPLGATIYDLYSLDDIPPEQLSTTSVNGNTITITYIGPTQGDT